MSCTLRALWSIFLCCKIPGVFWKKFFETSVVALWTLVLPFEMKSDTPKAPKPCPRFPRFLGPA